MLNRRDPAAPTSASLTADQAPAAPSESFLANYSDGLDLMAVVRTIRKQLRPILLFTLVLTLVGVAFAYTRPVIYRATASVAIESNQNNSNKKIEEGAPASLFGDDLQTQSQVLQSRNVYAKAVRELKLWEHPEFDPRVVSRGWVGQIKSTLGMDGGASGAAKEWTEDALVEALIGSFSAQSSSRIVTRSRVVELSFNSEDPRLAARAVNAWVKAFIDRIRLGLLALQARKVKNWRLLENKTAQEWLKELGGENVYRVIWEPLLKGKFGPYADQISAVWFWNKLKLRGGSRGKGGEERLAYFEGGFVELAEALASRIESLGGRVLLKHPVKAIRKQENRWETITTQQIFTSDAVIATPSLPLIANMIRDWADNSYIKKLERIQYLSNICLVLELDRPLSSTYWLNVNDPSFPFVGVIEHTNFERADTYGGRHIVYLSKYLPHTDKLYEMSKDEFLEFSIPYLQKMFPAFKRKWIMKHNLWRARWSQPVVEKHYSSLIPTEITPYEKLFISSMAQIYPEDRGTNYAIKAGKYIAYQAQELK